MKKSELKATVTWSKPAAKLKKLMNDQGFGLYWTVHVTPDSLAVSGPGKGRDVMGQKLSRWYNDQLDLGLYTMEYYRNGRLSHYHYVSDIERYQ